MHTYIHTRLHKSRSSVNDKNCNQFPIDFLLLYMYMINMTKKIDLMDESILRLTSIERIHYYTLSKKSFITFDIDSKKKKESNSLNKPINKLTTTLKTVNHYGFLDK